MKSKKDLDIALWDHKTVEERFNFIQDLVVKENIIIYTNYISMLFSLLENYNIPDNIEYSIYKNIIIYTAQIAEALVVSILDYLFTEEILNETDVLGAEYTSIHKSTTIDSNQIFNKLEELELIKLNSTGLKVKLEFQKLHAKRFKKNANFNEIINICTTCEFFSEDFINSLKKLQKKRNKIHIGAMELPDKLYTFKDVENSFLELSVVIEECKSQLPIFD